MKKLIDSGWLQGKLEKLEARGKEAKGKMETLKDTTYHAYWEKEYQKCRKWWFFYHGALKKMEAQLPKPEEQKLSI